MWLDDCPNSKSWASLGNMNQRKFSAFSVNMVLWSGSGYLLAICEKKYNNNNNNNEILHYSTMHARHMYLSRLVERVPGRLQTFGKIGRTRVLHGNLALRNDHLAVRVPDGAQPLTIAEHVIRVVFPLARLGVQRVLRQQFPALGGHHLERFKHKGHLVVRHEERQGYAREAGPEHLERRVFLVPAQVVPVQPLVLQQHVFVFGGQRVVDAQQVLSVRAGARAAAARLHAEHVVEDCAHEIVVQERSARVPDHQRERGQPFHRLRTVAQHQYFGHRLQERQYRPETENTNITTITTTKSSRE